MLFLGVERRFDLAIGPILEQRCSFLQAMTSIHGDCCRKGRIFPPRPRSAIAGCRDACTSLSRTRRFGRQAAGRLLLTRSGRQRRPDRVLKDLQPIHALIYGAVAFNRLTRDLRGHDGFKPDVYLEVEAGWRIPARRKNSIRIFAVAARR